MAKSLRSKSKLKSKSVTRKVAYQPTVDARNARIAEKLKAEHEKAKAEKASEAGEAGEEKMEVEGEAEKVSTSGWRNARHHVYKKNKKNKKSGGVFTKFGKK